MNSVNEESGPVVIIGKRGAEKTSLVKDIICRLLDSTHKTVVSPIPLFSDDHPNTTTFSEYTPEIIEEVILQQKNLIQELGRDQCSHSLVVLNDCIHDENFCKNVSFRTLFLNSLSYKLMTILTHQLPLSIRPSLRLNIGYVFILRETILSNQKRLYDMYASHLFDSFQHFQEVLMRATYDDYSCLVIDCKNNRHFHYKATLF